MKISHLAIWTVDLEKMKQFYTQYFGGVSNQKYYNPSKQFTSYFISFADGCKLELMHRPDIALSKQVAPAEQLGITHFALEVGSKEAVDTLTNQLRAAGYHILGQPRTTGDGHYESVVADPEGNRVEIVA